MQMKRSFGGRAPGRESRPIGRALALLGVALALGLMQACSPQAAEDPAAKTTTPYVAVARGRVDVEGGLLRLAPRVAGTIAQVAVKEGDAVAQGALIATLDTQGARLAVDGAKAEVAGAQAQVRVAQLRAKAAQTEAQRMTTAAASGVAKGQAATQAQVELAEAQAQEAVARATLRQAEEGVARARHVLAEHRITAPVAGTVVQINTQAGEAVAADGPAVFVLLPDKPRIVRAELNESYVNAVKPGMSARVQTGDSGESWHAQVLRVAQVFSPSTLIDDSAQRAGARSVECVLALDPKAPLRIGQRVLVRIEAAHDAPPSTP